MVSKGWSALRNRAERGPSAQYLKLKPKDSANIHFLVQEEEDVVFFRQHYIDGQYRICEDDTEDLTGNCRYCEAADKRPSDNYAFNVLDRKDSKVRVLALNATHAQAILEFLDEYGSLTTTDYKVKRTGTVSDTRYTFLPTSKIKKWDAVEKKAYEERYDLEALYDAKNKNPKPEEKAGAKKKKVQDETKASPPSTKVKKPKDKPAPVDDEADGETPKKKKKV